MALAVIGAGYGRTGTLSLKQALEALGYDRCHHMYEVINNPGEDQDWVAATLATARGEPVDWERMYAGYQAAVDWPTCHFYRELAAYYPQAKVVLTVRDPAGWYDSISNTTLRVIRQAMKANREPNLGTELVVKGGFDGNIDDADHAVAKFNRHTQEVIDSIEPQRLLVYEVSQGWEPLCAFLGKPVPDQPFPRINSRDEFDEIFFGNR